MRMQQNPHLPSLLFLLPSLVVASFDCHNVRIDRTSFDLSPLKGPHSVTTTIDTTPPSIKNLTVTIDVCRALKKPKGSSKDDACPSGTRVCGIERTINEGDNSNTISKVIPIAGEFLHENRPLDPHWTRLKSSPSHSDSEKEGLRGEFHGGKYNGRKQKAIVEFLCDSTTDGNDGADEGDDGKDDGDAEERRLRIREDEKEKDSSLKFLSYKPLSPDSEEDVLRLEWRTKHACEDEKNSDGSSGHWGFFTWFIIIVFLATATYLIFGSWLNYNRYGARGWDLLPHGDTIRDVPYLLRDWSRRVVSTVQGGGSRGGYSAV
ncbi:hypothetical protein FGG08_002428 [Glutinoglossum americanum]|uniref:Autophagy-related protein 27 n=1 Tax=Glutinoglossum americanum TaxID=1670608 RepID=A0A9P8I6C4_9PEZI|nr:hypothetical protein FGG08_002428 [Glutinoglossum americanum]